MSFLQHRIFRRNYGVLQLVNTRRDLAACVKNNDELYIVWLRGEPLAANPIPLVGLHLNADMASLGINREQATQRNSAVRAVTGQNIAGVQCVNQCAVGIGRIG